MDKNIIIDFYRKIVDINRSHNVFLYRVLSIDIKNRYSLMIDIDYYRLISVIGLSINSVCVIVWEHLHSEPMNQPETTQ